MNEFGETKRCFIHPNRPCLADCVSHCGGKHPCKIINSLVNIAMNTKRK